MKHTVTTSRTDKHVIELLPNEVRDAIRKVVQAKGVLLPDDCQWEFDDLEQPACRIIWYNKESDAQVDVKLLREG